MTSNQGGGFSPGKPITPQPPGSTSGDAGSAPPTAAVARPERTKWGCLVAMWLPIFLAVAACGLAQWNPEWLRRWAESRAELQTSASRLADDWGDEAGRRKLAGRRVEVAGFVVSITRHGAWVDVGLGERENGPELVRIRCESQGPAEVGHHAVVRGRVAEAEAGAGAERPVRLYGGLVLTASR